MQLIAITLADGQATPVNHTFSPVNIKGDVAKLVDRSSGIAIGNPTLTYSVREPVKGSRAYKISVKIVVPTLEVTSPSTSTGIQPAPTKAYDHLVNLEFVCPERGTRPNRQDILAYAKNALNNALVTAAVLDYDSPF